MEEWLIHHQAWCRLAFFITTFGLLAAWESAKWWRPWLTSRYLRWGRHFGLSLISTICIRFIFPLFTIGAAVAAQSNDIGLLNQSHLPFLSRVLLGIIAMDFVIYLQHRMMHKYHFLWRMHRVHHVDKHLDVSTGIRFHPAEEIFSMGVKILGVAFFGVPPIAAFIFEIVLNMAALYTHVNVQLKGETDLALRRLIVTPGMHRIHHSDYSPETNSNYGFCLSIWDKLFGSYTHIAQSGERKLVIGLEEYQDPKYQTLENMLLLPFNIRSLKARPKKYFRTKMKEGEGEPS